MHETLKNTFPVLFCVSAAGFFGCPLFLLIISVIKGFWVKDNPNFEERIEGYLITIILNYAGVIVICVLCAVSTWVAYKTHLITIGTVPGHPQDRMGLTLPVLGIGIVLSRIIAAVRVTKRMRELREKGIPLLQSQEGAGVRRNLAGLVLDADWFVVGMVIVIWSCVEYSLGCQVVFIFHH
jgi:hypothetical protein